MRKLRPNHVLVLTEWYRRHQLAITTWGKDNEVTWRVTPSKLRKLNDGLYRTARIIIFSDDSDALLFRMVWGTL